MNPMMEALAKAKADDTTVVVKPRVTIRNGEVVKKVDKVAPAASLPQYGKREHPPHVAGEMCPHCEGTQRRFHHLNKLWEQCFRCTDGRGRLSHRDLHFYEERLRRGLPLCNWYPK